MSMRELDLARIRWLVPANLAADPILREHLEVVAKQAAGEEIYTVNTRSIYHTRHPVVGELAIKELRFESWPRRLRATFTHRHRILCEFRAAMIFEERGGLLPKPYGAAIEFERSLISRVLIFMDWIPNARTLTELVRNWSAAQFAEHVPALAEFLVSCADRGLVHGRHSSENILFSDDRGYQLIDFSHAQIYSDFNARGFIHDAARIGSRLLGEDVASRAAVNILFEEIARAAHKPTVSAATLARECDWIMDASKQRQRIKRNVRTFWRGMPFRLRRN
jgi:tRNA A-37 threonylcarbamoyl transferase component Bud32